VLALDDAGHKKVAILGLAEYGHQVTRAQQLQNRSFNASQQQCGLIAVSGQDHDGWFGQRANAAADALGPFRRSIGRGYVSRMYHLYDQLIRGSPLEAHHGHRGSLLQRWNVGDGAEISVVNATVVTLQYRDGHPSAESRWMEESSGDHSELIGCRDGSDRWEQPIGGANDTGDHSPTSRLTRTCRCS